MSNFRYPSITAQTEKEQLQQLKSYLYQLVEQLNNAAPISREGSVSIPQSQERANSQSNNAVTDFTTLKGLIIKSADIVQAYGDKLEQRLEGKYVAQSEFGSYQQQTSNQISAEATRIEQQYQSLQQVVTGLQTKALETQGYIRTGVLHYAGADDPLPEGLPVYGMEVGQQAEDGTFRRFSRFTSYSLAFFDNQGQEFATIREGKLSLRHAAVTLSFALGGFADEVLSDGALVTRWKGI